MKIALAQIRCEPGDVARNERTILGRIREAAAAGRDLIVFPEMCDTGYHMPSIVATASSWDRGVYPRMAAAAADAKIAVIAGLSERVGADIYNSIAVIGPDGNLFEKYRKLHLITAEPVREERHIKPGDRIALCNVAGFKIGLMTCYDIRFPELARKLALAGAELLVIPAAFPLARIEHWEILARARAIENQVYVAAVNRVGEDRGLVHGGSSRLLDPFGLPLASASTAGEELATGELSRARLNEVREGLKVFRDRRSDIYG